MMLPYTAEPGSSMNTGKFNSHCTGATKWYLLLFVVLLLGAALLFRFVMTPVVENDGSQPVGVVTQFSGEVNMIRNDSYYAVSTGVSLHIKDIIITGKDASLQMDMIDGTILRLGDNSRVVLSDYKVDDKKKVVGAMVNVLSGWLRFAVAKLQKNASYNFNTPVMMVGVRGTGGIIRVDNNESSLFLGHGHVQVQRSYGSNDEVKGSDVRAGQFVNRKRGGDFEYTYKVPAYFTKRIPKSFHRYNKMLHRARELERRFVQPTFQRKVTPRDVEGLMRQHPHYHFRRRFEEYRFRRGPGADEPRRKDWGDGRKDWDSRRDSKRDKDWDSRRDKDWDSKRDKDWDSKRDKDWDSKRDKDWDSRRPDRFGPRSGKGYPDKSRPKERFHTKTVRPKRYGPKRYKAKPVYKEDAIKKDKTSKSYEIYPDYIKKR
jgi:hypothetical protein